MKRLRKIRKEQGFTQISLAETCNKLAGLDVVTRDDISKIERGETSAPNYKTAGLIALALGYKNIFDLFEVLKDVNDK